MANAKKNDLVFSEIYSTYLNGGRKNNAAATRQAATERMYVRILTELCANRFEWLGLPESVDRRFLELSLVWRGLAVFYRDKDSDQYFAVQGSGAGHTNFLDNPVSFTVIGPGIGAGHAVTLNALPQRDGEGVRTEAECVPIWANYLRCPDLDVIQLYATKLAKLDRTIEITSDNMRKTKYVQAPENERLSWSNILKQIAEGQDAIFGVQSMQMETIQVLDLSADPLALPNLMIAKSKLWNECMGLLGINNANQDKKERLVAAEVGANDEQVQATRNIALNARQHACDQINALYGLTVSVDFKSEPVEALDGESETPKDDETPKLEGKK